MFCDNMDSGWDDFAEQNKSTTEDIGGGKYTLVKGLCMTDTPSWTTL